MNHGSSPLTFLRYELKYHIPIWLMDDISNYIEAYCELDPYSADSPDHFYQINNIYFDTPKLLFLERRRAHIGNRFNMRIRSYGDQSRPPYFFEVKKKQGGLITKTRGKVYDTNYQKYFFDSQALEESNDKNLKEFIYLHFIHDTWPKVFTQYKRKAYLSVVDDYARVTFDKELKYMPARGLTICPQDPELLNYDSPQNFSNPNCNIVLELKCETHVPQWFIDLIRYFNLERSSFSKYVHAMEALGEGQNTVISDRLPGIAL